MNEACSRGDGPHLCPCNTHNSKLANVRTKGVLKPPRLLSLSQEQKSTHVLQKQSAKHVKTPNPQQKNL